jgi:hypothetical protein
VIRINAIFAQTPSNPWPARRAFDLGGAAPVLRVADVERTCQWYHEELGFVVARFEGDGLDARAMVALDDARILVRPMGPGEHGLSCWLRAAQGADVQIAVRGVAAYYERIRGWVRVMRMSPSPTGDRVTTLLVEDCDGHVLMFTGMDEPSDPAGP